MRATRAYIAGLGTAGSLVAGAALLFTLASAVVAFRGWPQLDMPGSQPAAVLIRVPAAAAPDFRTARRLAAVPSAGAPAAGIGTAAAAGGASSSGPNGGPRGAGAAPGTGLGGPLTPRTSSQVLPVPRCGSSCTATAPGVGLLGVLPPPTGALTGVISSAGSDLQGTLNGLNGTANRVLGQPGPLRAAGSNQPGTHPAPAPASAG